jgi:hypothetical protein
MSLSQAPSDLWDEVRAAERYRDEHLKPVLDLVEKAAGYNYNQKLPESADLENHAFEFTSLVLPTIVQDNPRWRLSTDDPQFDQLTRRLQFNMNRWSEHVNLRDVLIPIGYDWAYGWGVGLLANVPMPGMDPTEPATPFTQRAYRIAPELFGWDPHAAKIDEARFFFQVTLEDKEDVLARADFEGWHTGVISGAAYTNLPSQTWEHPLSPWLSPGRADGPDRKQIAIYEIWVPEAVHPDVAGVPGFHGTIFTLVKGQESEYARLPRPMYGPSWGPYAVAGAYTIPGDPHPLSPLIAVKPQNDMLNTVAKANALSASKYKKHVYADAANQGLIESIQNDPHLFVKAIEGLTRDSVVQMEFGGVTEQGLTQEAQMRDRRDRNSGMNIMGMEGQDPRVSATHTDVSDRKSSTRSGFMKAQYMNFVRQLGKTLAWYMAGELTGQPLPQDVINITVEPMSLSRPSESVLQQRAMIKMGILQQLATMAMTMPHVDIRGIARDMGDALDDPNFENYISPEIATAMMAASMEESEEAGVPFQPGGGAAPPSGPPVQNPRSLPGYTRGAERTAEVRSRTGA